VARGGVTPSEADLARTCAIVVGNEAHGLAPELAGHVDATVTIAMAGAAESLNVAMATTVLCFEAARQHAASGRTDPTDGEARR
jgi:TrmH family RNA methyltransferase